MADNILDAACQSESPQTAKRTILETDRCVSGHVTDREDGASVALSSLDAEVFVDPDHPHKVFEGLNRLRLNSVLCDVILCSEGQEVPCHRYVLASFSPYFEAMFTSGMRESTQDRVTISGLGPHMIGLLVNYAYTAKVSISTDNVQALLLASDLLEVTAVREACWKYMRRHMDTNNCVEIYCFADDHSCKMLKKQSMNFILKRFSVIYQQEAFLSLSVERLTEFLSSDHLNVPKEDMVFEAAMLWLDKFPTRKQSVGQVLEHIRLPLISPAYLHTVVERLDVVKEQQGCVRFISEAKERPCCNTARPRRTTVLMTFKQDIFESFDPLTNQWKTLRPVPGSDSWSEDTAQYYAVVTSGSTLYWAGGRTYYPDENHEMWRYDVNHNSWLQMASMNMPRLNFSLVMLDGYVFAVGGCTEEVSMERYDPKSDTWQLMETDSVKEHVTSCSCDVVALDGHLYFIGPNDQNPNKPQNIKYNPKTSVWTEVAPLQIPRRESAACVLNGKIYVTGGGTVIDEHEDVVYIITTEKTMECYNPQTNQWTMCASMQEGRYSPSMAVVDGMIYVVGGLPVSVGVEDHGCVRNIECYFEETDTWETVGEIPYVRYEISCVSLELRNDHGQPKEDDTDGD